MITTVLYVAALLLLGAPLMVLLTQWWRIRENAHFGALASLYVVYLANEIAGIHLGTAYHFFAVLIDAVLLSVATVIVCRTDRPEEAPQPTFALMDSLLAVALLASVVMFFLHPDTVGTIVVGNLLLVLIVNAVILIRNIEDHSIPYIRLLGLWLLHRMALFHPNRAVHLAMAILFAAALVYTIGRRILAVNKRQVQEKDLLVRARDVVVSMLYDVSSSEKSISSLDFTLVRILEAIIEALSVEGAAVYTREDPDDSSSPLRFSQSSGIFWTMGMDMDQIASKTTFIKKHLQKESFKPGEGVVGLAAQSSEALELDRGHHRRRMIELGLNPHNVRNVLAVPLQVKDRLLGVLVVQNRKEKTSFSDDDFHLLQALAEQASISINNVRMYEELARADRLRQEMNIATDIQRQLLPKKVPTAGNLRIHPFIRPAKEVGGDYYDFIESQEGHHSFVIGDVSGKGLPAGMIMVIARTTLQIVARGKSDVKHVVTRFSEEMYPRMRRGQFMTLNFLRWEDESRTLHYAGAGHEHILWYRKERGYTEKIKAGGIAVGLVEEPGQLIKRSRLQTQAGDVIVLYTDGITEARNTRDDMFTLPRLQDSVDKYAHLADPEKISSGILQEVMEFIGDAEQYDDITLLVATVS